MSELIQYKCPCCGGAVEFNSSVQKMKCPYCDSEFDMEALKEYDEALKQEAEHKDETNWENVADREWQDDEKEKMNIYVCQSCGGEIVCDENTAAMSCPYCDNPVVMKGKLSGDLKPDYVIPFQLEKEDAKKKFQEHLKGKILLPKVFRSENHIDEIKGVYVPFWLFDADTDANLRYRGTKIRVWSDSKYDYTQTSYYAVGRHGKMRFEQVPVDGSSKMPDDLMESIEPYDFSKAVDFQTAYLAGYLADRYDVDAKQSENRANERIRTGAESEIRKTIKGYDTLTPENISIQLKNGASHYALYPVWILNTTWKGKQYIFAMNGQTGKFVGNLPTDRSAYARWLIGLAAGIGAAVFGILSLIWVV